MSAVASSRPDPSSSRSCAGSETTPSATVKRTGQQLLEGFIEEIDRDG